MTTITAAMLGVPDHDNFDISMEAVEEVDMIEYVEEEPSVGSKFQGRESNHSSLEESPPPPLLTPVTTPNTTVSEKTTKRTTAPNPPLPTSKTPSPKRPNNPMPVVDGAEDEKGVQRAPLTLIDLGFLTEEERGTILEVLKRDEELRKSEEVRVKKLKTELHELRKKAAVNTDDDQSNTPGCARCHEEYGLFSSGFQCPKCKHHVCAKCQVFTPTGKRWLCVVCHKAMQIKIESGEWFYEKLEVAEKVTLFGSDLVKASLAKAKGDPSNPAKLTIDDLRPSSSAESTPRTKHRVRHRRTNSNPKDLRNYRHADSASDRDSGWSQHNGASLDASESSQRSSLHEDESHQRSSRYGHERGQHATDNKMHGKAGHPIPRWEVHREETESLSYSSSSSDITTETESSYSRNSQDNASWSQTESQGQMTPPFGNGRQKMRVVASIHSSTTGSEHVNTDSEPDDTTEATTGFRFTRVSVKKNPHMPSTPTRDVYGTSLEPTIEEQDHLVPAADTASIASGYTPQRSRAGSTARSRSGSTAGPSTLGASNYDISDPVRAEEVDARLTAELEHGPEILVHEAEPTKVEEGLGREDEDIDRYLAATSSTSAIAATSTTGATRSLSLTPSSAHGESSVGNFASSEQNGRSNGGPPLVEQGSLDRETDDSYAGSVSGVTSVSGVSQSVSQKGIDYSPDRSYTRYASASDSSSVTTETTLTRRLQRQDRAYFPPLTKGSSASLTSLYSEAGENYGKFPITGDIQFGLSYNYKIGLFEIKVINCRDLAPTDLKKNKSDPYVKTYLLPDKTKNGKRKTKVKRGTINPMFEETIKYTISHSELQTRTLNVSVWNRDAFGRNTFLGEVLMPLDTISVDNYKPQWHALCNKAPPSESSLSYKGDIILALRFEPANIDGQVDTEEEATSSPDKQKKKKGKRKGSSPTKKNGGSLHINIKEAKNLMAVRMNGSSNPFVKCYLEPDRSKQGKRKTNVVKNNLNPSWQYQMYYSNVTLKSLKQRCLELTVWDYDTIGSNDFLGGVRLGMGTGLSFGKDVDWMDSTADEIHTWEKMLRNPGEWMEATLTLRPNMNSKGGT